MELTEIRDLVSGKVEKARARVKDAERHMQDAQSELENARRLLEEAERDAEMRLNAINIVEETITAYHQLGSRQPYIGMGQEDAMREALRTRNEAMTAADLASMLAAGGYAFTSGNRGNSIMVAATLNRKGYFTKAKEGGRSLIGLKEWEGEKENPWGDEEDRQADRGLVFPPS
jgi:hypothetical protein